MMSRILIVVLALSTSLLAHHEPKWSALKKGRLNQESRELSAFKEWRDRSRKALEAEKQEPRKTEVERSFNQKANESSSSVDCGVVCSLPQNRIQIEAKIHYFFEGDVVPDDIGDSITVTLNIKGAGSERKGYFIISSLEPNFLTKKGNVFRPRIDGMGSLNEKAWSYSLLAIMEEADCRRLLTEQVETVNLGPFIITRSDLIHKGLEALLLDLKKRRDAASRK